MNRTNTELTLKFDDKEFLYERNESLLGKMEAVGIVKQVFPLHGILIYFSPVICNSRWQPIDDIFWMQMKLGGNNFWGIGLLTGWTSHGSQ